MSIERRVPAIAPFTLPSPVLAHLHRPLPRVLSLEEVGRFLDAAPGPGLKCKAALSIGYGAGLRAGEVMMRRVGDIDSKQTRRSLALLEWACH